MLCTRVKPDTLHFRMCWISSKETLIRWIVKALLTAVLVSSLMTATIGNLYSKEVRTEPMIGLLTLENDLFN